MKYRRFIGNFTLLEKRVKILDYELLNQICNVLRLKVGERIILGDGNLNEAVCEIRDLQKDCIEVDMIEIRKNTNEPNIHVVLYCSILKRENFELAAQKVTEAGVSEIVPLISARTVKLNLRKDRLEKIIKEAAEQSGRGIVPKISDSMEFYEAVMQAAKNENNIFLDPSGPNIENWKLKIGNSRFLGIWVGPEGGWTEEEIVQATSAGFVVAGLGPLTLRAETAAIIASYIASHQ